MRWFAKGHLTEVVDGDLRMKFAWLLEDAGIVRELSATARDASNPFWYKMSLIILFDQLTRNIYRGTARAYSGDEIILPLALQLAKSIEEMPFHFQATICICLCHAEDNRIQNILRSILDRISKRNKRDSCLLVAALQEIQKKHQERIALFCRFPERNAALGRTNFVEEAAYLAQL